MAQSYFDATKDNNYVFVRSADTDQLITTLPKASVAISSSSGVILLAIGVNIPQFSRLWTDIDWTKCDPAPVGYANTIEMAQAMCVYFPAQVITLNYP